MSIKQVVAGFVACLVLPTIGLAQSDVAATLAARIRAVLPGSSVTVPDPDGLDIAYSGQTRSVGIGSVRAACAQGQRACDAAIEEYAKRAASYMLETAPMAPAQLLAAVRSKTYLETMREQMGSSLEFVSTPITEDLVNACYRVLPQGRRPVQTSDLSSMKLDKPAALSLCQSNLRKKLPPLAKQWQQLPVQGIGTIRLDEAAGYLLSSEEWRPLAKRLGSLIVAAPDSDTVLYASETTVIDLDALSSLARKLNATARVPLSPHALRWTEKGWVKALP